MIRKFFEEHCLLFDLICPWFFAALNKLLKTGEGRESERGEEKKRERKTEQENKSEI